jgi:uncharacterized protein YecT (DUF1311 family)
MSITEKVRFTILAALVFVFSGRESMASESGSCSDASTLSTLSELIQNTAVNGLTSEDRARIAAARKQGGAPTFDAIRTVARTNSTPKPKSTCAAILKLKVPTRAIETLGTNISALMSLQASGFRRDGDAVVADITYYSQLTDDGRSVFVEIRNASALAETVAIIGLATAMPAAPAAAPSKPAPAAQAKDAAAPAADPLCIGIDMDTTVGMLECTQRKFAAADRNLNVLYKQILASSLSSDRKATLKTEQRAWVAEKIKACKAAGAEFAGGTMEPVVVADCELQRTEERVTYLAQFR